MKRILFFALVINSLNTFSQVKNDNTIIIKNISFSFIMNSLLDQGYTIDKYDTLFHTIKTALKDGRREDGKPTNLFKIFLDIRVKDSLVIIKGQGVAAVTLQLFKNSTGYSETSNYYPIQNKGMKNSELRSSWVMMDNFAKSFKTDIVYSKQ